MIFSVIIFLMKLQCYALGNATFTGKLRLIAAENSNVNIPCTFSRTQSDMVTLILFYRNASQVGHVTPLYTLDARMMYEQTSKINDNKKDEKQLNELNNENNIRQSNLIDDNLFYRNQILLNKINRHLIKRSINRNQSKNSNERLTSSIGNVSMVNGISSLMHLLAIKGHLNQSRLNKINENTISEQINPLDNLSSNNQTITKLINLEKKNGNQYQTITDNLNINDNNQKNIYTNYYKQHLINKHDNYRSSFFYQLQNDDKQNWLSDRVETSVPLDRNQFNNLFDQNKEEEISIKDKNKKSNSEIESLNLRTTLNNLEQQSTTVDQPQHFVAPNLANRIHLNWPPSLLKNFQPYNKNLENSFTSINSSTAETLTTNRTKLESRSQTTNIRNYTKNEPLLHFNALLSIRNATEADSGEYLCRVDLRFGRTMIQHIILEIVSSPKTVIILDSNSQVLHDWTNVYLENTKTIFSCEVDGGRPQTPIEWLLNNELLNPTWSNSIKLQNSAVTRSQLQIQMTRELFNSSLTCRVQNQFYTMSSTIKIDLILKPQRITIRPSVTPLIVDNQIDLIAQTHGSFPPADLVCFLNNQTLTGETKKANHPKLFSTTTLIIKYVPQRLDHKEEILCKAINHAFPANESIDLRYKLDIHYKPILKLQIKNGNPNHLIQGSFLKLQCIIDSNPPFKEVQWFKNDLLFSALNNFVQTELRVDNYTSLVTNSLSKIDSGRYTCSARNMVGTTDSESITIDVLHAPECRQNQKFIYGIELGETTVIDCNLIANPSDRLTFHWRFHDSSGEAIDLATISTQIDDSFKKSINEPLYSALIQNSNSSFIEYKSSNQPVTNKYLSAIDKNEESSSSSNLNNMPFLIKNIDRNNLLQQIFISSNGTSSSSLHFTMKYPKKDSGSFIECWASNSIGVQKESCMYSLIALDVPDSVENCTISAPINNFHLLECSPGKSNGGLPPQKFHCEVYVYLEKKIKEDDQPEINNSNEQNDNQLINHFNQFDLNDYKQSNQKKLFNRIRNSELNNDNQYDDYFRTNDKPSSTESTKIISNQLILIANYTEYSYPTFVLSLVNMNLSKLNLNKLSSIDTLHLVVYSSNPKGHSNKISLDFNIGNQTSQLKHLIEQQINGQETTTLITMAIWFISTIIYLIISNKIRQVKMTRRYLNNCKKNAIKVNQNSLVPVNQGILPFIETNDSALQQCNVIGTNECHDASIYGCSSMIINHFEQKNYKTSPICLSSNELLKLKIKQLD